MKVHIDIQRLSDGRLRVEVMDESDDWGSQHGNIAIGAPRDAAEEARLIGRTVAGVVGVPKKASEPDPFVLAPVPPADSIPSDAYITGAGIRAALDAAIKEGWHLCMGYTKTNGEKSDRVVIPTKRSGNYLYAIDIGDARQPKTFRIERIGWVKKVVV